MLSALLAVDAAFKTSVKNFKRSGILNSLVQKPHEESSATLLILPFENIDVSFKQMNKMGFDDDEPLAEAANLGDVPSPSFITRNTTSIVFKVGDKRCCHEISSTNVQVYTNANNHDHGSSKVKLKNIVDYKWEEKHYPGHLIAIHIDKNTIAYVINVNNKIARMEGMVRVFNISKGFRSLIKGMSGEILDLQFAHIENQRILACIDVNSLYINKIDELERSLICNVIVKIDSPLKAYVPKYDKIAWCPFIDIPGEDDEDNQLIVWARGSTFQCFNINIIVAKHGIGKINLHDIKTGFVKYEDSAITITWIALSPDGSTLGVGSTDGFIRFYQIYIYDKEPRCLHEWQPHDGKPISSFFFLDNLTKNNSDAYWKYAITAANCNTEFKVWDCGNWNCLQTLNIVNGSDIQKPLRFIAEIDRTASYIVISSLENRACYILQVINSCTSRDLKNDESFSSKDISCGFTAQSPNSITKYSSSFISNVYIKSISEFPLNSGILSFSIVNAAIRRYKCAGDNYLCEELDDYDEETNSIYCVVIHMYIVQSKSMQECHILYQPKVQAVADIKSTFSNTTQSVHSKYSNNNNTNKNSNTNLATSDDISSDCCDLDKKPLNELTLGVTSSSKLSNASNSHKNLSSPSNGSTIVPPSGPASEPLCADIIAETKSAACGKSFMQVNLMTPEAFNSTSMERKTPEDVSSEVLNTILMLANVTDSNPANSVKSEKMITLNLTNNTIIEKQELQNQDVDTQASFISIQEDTGHGVLTGTDILISGGSSPSREVQEIMRVHDYDNSEDELMGGTKEEVFKSTSVEDHQSGDEITWQKIIKNEANKDSGVARTSYVASVTGNSSSSLNAFRGKSEDTKDVRGSSTNRHHMNNIMNDIHKTNEQGSSRFKIDLNKSNSPVDWQRDSTPEGHLTDLQNAANRMYQVVKSSIVLPNNVAPSVGTPVIVTDTRSAKNDINLQIQELTDLVKMQTSQISLLRSEINQLKSTSTTASTEIISNKIEMQFSKLVEQYLKRYDVEHKRKLSTFLAGKDVQYRELRDSIAQTINKCVNMQFNDVVPKVVNNEIQKQLIPIISSKFEILQQKMQHDFIKKLSSIDLVLQDNITEICKSKLVQTICNINFQTVLSGVQSSLQTAFIETMSGTLIPAYEKSSQNMFTQLHEAFSIGIKEFMEQFDNYLQQLQPMRDAAIDEMLDKFIAFNQNLEVLLCKNLNGIHEEISEIRQDVKSLEILLTRQIHEVIKMEVRNSLEVQVAALRSQTSTPAQMYDNKDTIKHLLIQGHINKAFHQALLANDLSLVEYTLRSADHNSVFTPECCLEQKVLLSLIQQISADMSNHNEVKQNYLAEALLAINPIDPITREHAPKVLDELFRNCHIFLYKYPKSPQCSNVRMLMKAVQAYKGQF